MEFRYRNWGWTYIYLPLKVVIQAFFSGGVRSTKLLKNSPFPFSRSENVAPDPPWGSVVFWDVKRASASIQQNTREGGGYTKTGGGPIKVFPRFLFVVIFCQFCWFL